MLGTEKTVDEEPKELKEHIADEVTEIADIDEQRRGRHMNNYARADRRLDTLARVLWGSSTCVAVAVVNGQFCIAVNEFSKRTKNTEQLRFIHKVMRYFKELVDLDSKKPEVIDQPKKVAARNEIFKEICKLRLKALDFGNIFVSETLFNQAIEDVFTAKNHNIEEFIDSYRKDARAFLCLYVEFSKLYKDFEKLENTITSKNPKDIIEFRDFRSTFSRDWKILQEELQAGTHAEAQISSYIDTQRSLFRTTSTIYIGISMLSCFHCHHLIQSANEIYQSKESNIRLTINIRGWHDRDFNAWICPSRFSEGYKAIDRQKLRNKVPLLNSIEASIGQKAREKTTILKDKNNPKGNMNASFSESETDIGITIADIKNKLQILTTMEFLEEEEFLSLHGNEKIEIILNMKQIATLLLQDAGFVASCNIPVDEKHENFFASCSDLILEQEKFYSSEIMLKVLQSAYFVGPIISASFQGCSLNKNGALIRVASLNQITTLGDGSCAFNAVALGIYDLMMQDKLPLDSDGIALLYKKLEIEPIENLKKQLIENDTTEIQRYLSPVLRELAVKQIEHNDTQG